ncbi:MAG: WD40/YVTN/BNR-like repeat-containing protein, partial [Thermoanaerobaculia bacterium]
VFRSDGYPWNDWTDLHIGNNALNISYVAADPSNGNVYALSGRHLFSSTDHGTSWKEAAPPLPDTPERGLRPTIVVDAGHDLYVTNLSSGPADHMVRLRADASAWDEVVRPGHFNSSTDVIAHPRQPGMLYFSDFQSIRRTLDRGVTWEQIPAPPGTTVTSAFADPRDPDTFLCLVQTTFNEPRLLMKTTDAGRTWSTVSTFPSDWYPSQIIISTSHPDVLYIATAAGYGNNTFARSVDGGKTWTALPKPPGSFSDSRSSYFSQEKLVIDPRDPNILYFATPFDYPGSLRPKVVRFDGGMWQSIDASIPESWDPTLALDPNGPLYFATSAHGVWQTDLGVRRRSALH